MQPNNQVIGVSLVASLDDAKRFAKQAATYVDVVAAANSAYLALSDDKFGIGAFVLWCHLDTIVTAAQPPNARYKLYMCKITALKDKIRYWIPNSTAQTAIKLLLPLERLGVEIQKNQGKNK